MSLFPPKRLLNAYSREATALVLVASAAMLALAGVSDATPTLGKFGSTPAKVTAQAVNAPPAPPPALELRDVSAEEALKLNSEIPVVGGPLTASKPFRLAGASSASQQQALECLTSAIYYESGQESDDGQRAVAQVILNRVRHPAYPNSVCGVVYQGSTRPTGCQFTFTCDGSLARAPMPGAWDRARKVAKSMLSGAVYAPVGHATHYHANYVVPYWASSLVKTQVVGAHLFYRWSGNWGQPGAFAQAYSGREPNAAALRTAALSVPHVIPRAISNAVASLDAKPGVEVKENGKRVMVHFSPQARAAVEAVKVVPYVERVSASDNLRFALDGGKPETTGQPAFGRVTEAKEAVSTPAS